MEAISYVIYDETGALQGSYMNWVIPPEHEGHYILCDEHIRLWWVYYRANAARDGVELIPVAPPEDPPVEPDPV